MPTRPQHLRESHSPVPHSSRQLDRRRRWASRVGAILAIVFLITANAHAQGCAQCLDSTRSTPPAVQAAYRHAIELLGGFGVALFLAGLYLLRREP